MLLDQYLAIFLQVKRLNSYKNLREMNAIIAKFGVKIVSKKLGIYF